MRSLETGAPFKRKRGSSLAAEWTRYYAGWVDKIEGSTAAPYSAPSVDYTVPEPYGVVAVLTPWNGGMVSAAMKVAPALAAGNTVVLKPAELAAARPAALRRALPRGRHPARRRQRRPRRRRRPARRSWTDRVGKISFTGGGATARRIMAAAADTLTPVVLELGGKSANVVFADADLDAAATATRRARSPTSPDRAACCPRACSSRRRVRRVVEARWSR